MVRSVYRGCYFLAMYSGLRAVGNRLRSAAVATTSAVSQLHGMAIASPGLGSLLVQVHFRVRPASATIDGVFGILSLKQAVPTVGRWSYRYLCATSHFGCGHLEVAFFERHGTVTFYGIRNMASANARRLGLQGLSSRLRLVRAGENEQVLALLARCLQEQGLVTKHARPQDCLALAVDDRLLPPANQAQAKRSLYRKYQKLSEVFAGESA